MINRQSIWIAMNLNTIAQKIRIFFHRTPEVQLPDPLVEQLIKSLQVTHEEECACDEFHDLMDQYAETDIRGEDAARLMPLLKNHLEICHECCEEYDALLNVLQAAIENS
jgi:hypothetical protein